MDFTPASQNGIIPPSETLTRQSRLGLAASSTSTIYGNELVLKAISDASMYKTTPVTFYRRVGSTGTATAIGTGTWINTNTSVLVTSNQGTGTYQLYCSWPGEGLYAPQSTESTPLSYTVNAGYPLNATISHTVSPATNNLVVGEGTATFTVTVSTSTMLTDTLSFYIGNIYYGQSSFVNNIATLSIDNLPAGKFTIRTIWPGATISGVPYEGFTYNIPYQVAFGSIVDVPLSISVTPKQGVVNETAIVLFSEFTSSTNYVGDVSFYLNQLGIYSPSDSYLYGVENNGTYSTTLVYIDRNIYLNNPFTIKEYGSTEFTIDPNSIVAGVNGPPFWTFNFTPAIPDSVRLTGVFSNGTPQLISNKLLATVPLLNNSASAVIPGSNVSTTTGTYVISAVYNGNLSSSPKYYPRSSTLTEYTIVERNSIDSIVLSVNPNPSVFDFQDTTFTANISAPGPVPGSITFTQNNIFVGSAPIINNSASLTLPTLNVGVYTIVANYAGSSVIPKYFSTSSNEVTYRSVPKFVYPGTLTLTGPSTLYPIGNDGIFTITASVNTLTSGIITLTAVGETSMVVTTSTPAISQTQVEFFTGTVAGKIDPRPSNSTTSSQTTSTQQIPFTNFATGVTTFVTSTSVTVRTTSTIYSPYISSGISTIGQNVANRRNNGGTDYFVTTIDSKFLNVNTNFLINGKGPYTIVSIVPPTGGAGVEKVIVYNPQGDGGLRTGPINLTFPAQVSIGTTTVSISTTTTRAGYAETTTVTGAFTGTTTARISVNPGLFRSDRVYLQASWEGQGIVAPGYTPYLGTSSNIVTATVVQPTISLAASTGTYAASQSPTFTVTANTGSVTTNTVRLYNSSTVIATSAIPANTSSVQIIVPPGSITSPVFAPFTLPANNIVPAGLQANYSTTSSVRFQAGDNIIKSTFTATNQNGTLNTTVYSVVTSTKLTVFDPYVWELRVTPRFATPIQNLYFPTTVTISSATNSYGVFAELTTTNVTTASNSVSVTFLPRTATTTTVSLSQAAYSYYTLNQSTSTATVTASVSITGLQTFLNPTGTITLFANNTLVTTATVTSTITNITFVPSQYAQSNTTLTVRARYNGDFANTISTGTANLSVTGFDAIVTASSSTQVSTGTYWPTVNLIANFGQGTGTPSNVNWLANGNFIASTPVVNNQSFLNNYAHPVGTTNFSVNYAANEFFSGTSNSLPITNLGYRYEGIVSTVTNATVYRNIQPDYNLGVVASVLEITHTNAPEPNGVQPSSIFETPNTWFSRVYAGATFSWSYQKQGQAGTFYSTVTNTSITPERGDPNPSVFSGNNTSTFQVIPLFYGPNGPLFEFLGFTPTNITLLGISDVYVYTINNGFVNGRESNKINGNVV